MKYISKLPNTDEKLKNELKKDGWKKLKEPSSLTAAMVLSMPFAIINSVICFIFILYLKPSIKQILYTDTPSFTFKIDIYSVFYVVIVFGFMVFHEFLHVIFIPNGLKGKKTFLE